VSATSALYLNSILPSRRVDAPPAMPELQDVPAAVLSLERELEITAMTDASRASIAAHINDLKAAYLLECETMWKHTDAIEAAWDGKPKPARKLPSLDTWEWVLLAGLAINVIGAAVLMLMARGWL
jgi:hypothetical protein